MCSINGVSMRCSGYGCHLTFRLRSWRVKNSDYPTDVPFLFFNHLMFWDYPIASPRAPFKPEAASSQQCEKRHEVHAFLRPNFEISPLFPRCRRLKTWGWVRIDPTSTFSLSTLWEPATSSCQAVSLATFKLLWRGADGVRGERSHPM